MLGQASMSEDERSGPFTQDVSDEEILEFIEQEEVVSTQEVAQEFDYHIQTARRRLKELEQEGKVKRKDVGKRFVWWISES